MKIGNQEFGRVAVLVLDQRPEDKNAAKALVETYGLLSRILRRRFPMPSGTGLDSTVLANETLVAEHEQAFRDAGLRFFPNWRESGEYRELLREGLRQESIYVVMDIGIGRYGHWGEILPEYTPVAVKKDEVNIINPEGRIDIRPKNPLSSM